MSYASPALNRLAEPSTLDGIAIPSFPDDAPRAVRGEIVVELPMRHAGTRALTLRYELQGPAGAPVVFVAGGISAHRHLAASGVFPENGWLNDLVGAGRALDPHQRIAHVQEADQQALARLVEAYFAMGVVSEAQAAAAVLGHNYPDSQWYADSYKLLQKGGLEPRENSGSWITRAGRRLLIGT